MRLGLPGTQGTRQRSPSHQWSAADFDRIQKIEQLEVLFGLAHNKPSLKPSGEGWGLWKVPERLSQRRSDSAAAIRRDSAYCNDENFKRLDSWGLELAAHWFSTTLPHFSPEELSWW